MTTVKHLKGLFDAQYNRECRRRNITPDIITNGEFLLWYDLVSNRIYEELNVQELTISISLSPVTTFTEYEIGAGFGGLRGYELTFSNNSASMNKLDIVEYANIPKLGQLAVGIPNKMSIYAKADGKYYVTLYPLVGNSGTLSITYKRVVELANGAGAGADIDYAIEMPRVWHPLLLRGLMAQAFPDMEDRFEILLRDSVNKRPNPSKDEITYNLGGFEDEDIDNGYSKNFNGG